VNRFGMKPTILGGLSMMALGLLLFRAGAGRGSFLLDVLPGMLVLGVGAAFAFMAVILASTTGVPENEAGLASAWSTPPSRWAGALGLAVLAAVAAAYSRGPSPGPTLKRSRPNSGYHAAFPSPGAGCVALGAIIAALILRLPREDDPD
jgi:hypothetical protein